MRSDLGEAGRKVSKFKFGQTEDYGIVSHLQREVCQVGEPRGQGLAKLSSVDMIAIGLDGCWTEVLFSTNFLTQIDAELAQCEPPHICQGDVLGIVAITSDQAARIEGQLVQVQFGEVTQFAKRK